MEYGHNRKKVVFYSTDKIHADLKIRLKYDGITQSAFFRGIMQGYIDKDPLINEFIDFLKTKEGGQGIQKRKQTRKLFEQGGDVATKFGLGDDEVESIFDIIEKEHPEL